MGVVFGVPKSGQWILRIADFPPVVVHWSDDEADEGNLDDS